MNQGTTQRNNFKSPQTYPPVTTTPPWDTNKPKPMTRRAIWGDNENKDEGFLSNTLRKKGKGLDVERIKPNNHDYKGENTQTEDFSWVKNATRIAVYDSMIASPRIIDVGPNETKVYIAEVTSTTFTLAREAGGTIPFTVIQELVENFIHAGFKEPVISILDDGNTIRFSDQGPGIRKSAAAQHPGFSSATEEMKKYIRGVGSGFPIVKSYLDVQHGRLFIEENIEQGAVVTISVKPLGETKVIPGNIENRELDAPPIETLTDREKNVMRLLLQRGPKRLTDVAKSLDIPASSVHNLLKRLTEMDLIQPDKNNSKVHILTARGKSVAAKFR